MVASACSVPTHSARRKSPPCPYHHRALRLSSRIGACFVSSSLNFHATTYVFAHHSKFPKELRNISSPYYTVLIPAYQAENTLNACLASAVSALDSSPDYPGTIQVVDDGSTDHTATITAHWAQRDPRIHVSTHASNQGRAIARNTGLDAIRTTAAQWVVFLDADNTLSAATWPMLWAQHNAYPEVDVWILRMMCVDSQGRALGPFYGTRVPFDPVSTLRDQPGQLLLGNFLDQFSAVRMASLPPAAFDASLRYLEDWDLWWRLWYQHRASFTIAEPMYGTYTVRPHQLTSTFQPDNPAYLENWVRIYDKILTALTLPPALGDAIAQQREVRRQQLHAAQAKGSLTRAP